MSPRPPAGYSGIPLVGKPGIREGADIAFSRAPTDFDVALGDLPEGVRVKGAVRAPLDVIVAFFTRRAEFERRLPALRRAMSPACGLWIAWPKRASGVAADITEDTVRAVALPTGLVDNKVCAIDETWSGLRLVIRGSCSSPRPGRAAPALGPRPRTPRSPATACPPARRAGSPPPPR